MTNIPALATNLILGGNIYCQIGTIEAAERPTRTVPVAPMALRCFNVEKNIRRNQSVTNMKDRVSNLMLSAPAAPRQLESETHSPLRLLRAQSGLSARELAARANVATSTISRIERGDRGIGPRARRQIAAALGCQERDLFELDERTGVPFEDLLGALAKLIQAGAHDIAAETAELLAARLRELHYESRRDELSFLVRTIMREAGSLLEAGRQQSSVPSVEDLKVFSGRIEQHRVLGGDAADHRHIQLMETWRQCDGELTSGFLDHLAELGLSKHVSIYDGAIKVRHIGNQTIFWTEEQRRAVIGREIFELAAPLEYTRLTHEALLDATRTGEVTHRLVSFNTGSRHATYKRAAFWFPRSGLIVGSPAPQD
jgi:transcriptional regulator with XRE-family HTH domain